MVDLPSPKNSYKGYRVQEFPKQKMNTKANEYDMRFTKCGITRLND